MSPVDPDEELLVSLEQILVVQDESIADSYEDNYVRLHCGPIWLIEGTSKEKIEIGEIELYYIDGTRALDNDLDIVDVCDSVGQDVYEYALALYNNGVLDPEIVGESFSNDALALHSISILPAFRGRKYGLRVTRKIAETVGYQCGAVVLKPSPLQFSIRSEDEEWVERMKMAEFGDDPKLAENRLTSYWKNLNLRSTHDPSIFLVSL